MARYRKTKKYTRERIMSPKKCSPKSFRVKTVSKKKKLVICCPKGKFSKGRCQVGTKLQAIMRKK